MMKGYTYLLLLVTSLSAAPLIFTLVQEKTVLVSMVTLSLISWKFLKTSNHVLLMLLILEVLMLASSLVLGLNASLFLLPPEALFVFFSFAVVEASTGVATLVAFSRNYGNESVSVLGPS